MAGALVNGTTRLFHSWTKGDRRNAAEMIRIGGLVPIEGFEMKDDSNRAGKGSAKISVDSGHDRSPLPVFVSSSAANPFDTCPASPSFLVHDSNPSIKHAKSDTQIVVPSTPQSSLAITHPQPATSQWVVQKPLPGPLRPRTAPSSPATLGIAELPGSLPIEDPSTYPHSMKMLAHEAGACAQVAIPCKAVGQSQGRRRGESMDLERCRKQSRNAVLHKKTAAQSSSSLPGLKQQRLVSCPADSRSSSHDSAKMVPSAAPTKAARPLRPSPLVLQKPWTGRATQDETTPKLVPCTPTVVLPEVEELHATIAAQDQTISTLTAQFASLQNSHVAHASLTDAHSKELESLKSYINVLEEQQQSTAKESSQVNPSANLGDMFNVSQSPEQARRPSVGSASSTSIHSYQSAFEFQKQIAQDLAAEVNVLRSKLEQADKQIVEAEAIRTERDFLDHTLKETQSQIELVLSHLNQSQMSREALQNQVQLLQSRLEAANASRLDALEANHELEATMNEMQKWRSNPTGGTDSKAAGESRQSIVDSPKANARNAEHRATPSENPLEGVRTLQFAESASSSPMEAGTRPEGTALDKSDRSNTSRQGDQGYLKQVKDSKGRTVGRPDSTSATPISVAGSRHLEDQIRELHRKIAEQSSVMRFIQTERDDIALLLHREIRRQARATNNLEHPAAASLSAKSDVDRAIVEVQAQVRRRMVSNGECKPYEVATDPQHRIEQLEKEIEYHVKDILLYKLDVKGYKKDLKRADAKMRRLQNATSCGQQHVAASPLSSTSASSSTLMGLGLLTSPTEPSPLSAPDGMPPFAANLAPPYIPASSPRSKSPLGMHKRVPRPPLTPPPSMRPFTPPSSSTPKRLRRQTSQGLQTPSLAQRSHPVVCTPERPQRVGTQRSISESIISSYASRRTPEDTPEQRESRGEGADAQLPSVDLMRDLEIASRRKAMSA